MDGRVEGEEEVKAAVILRDPTVDEGQRGAVWVSFGTYYLVLYGTQYKK